MNSLSKILYLKSVTKPVIGPPSLGEPLYEYVNGRVQEGGPEGGGGGDLGRLQLRHLGREKDREREIIGLELHLN